MWQISHSTRKKLQNRSIPLAFHINTVPVDSLQVCVLLLGCENYGLSLLTLKSHTSITYLLIYYLLTPFSKFLLEKLTGFQIVKTFPAFYGIRTFITALTIARHLYLSWASSIQSIPPHPTSWRSNSILSPLLRLEDPGVAGGQNSDTYLLTPWCRVPLEKLTSKLCS